MSEEIMTSAADLTTMIGLRAENDGLRIALTQERKATKDERATRRAAGADNGALYLALERLLAFTISGRVLPDADRALIERAVSSDHPGRALLAELDAARAVVAAAQDVLDNAAPVENDVHAVPDMQIARLDRAMHAATKARSE